MQKYQRHPDISVGFLMIQTVVFSRAKGAGASKHIRDMIPDVDIRKYKYKI